MTKTMLIKAIQVEGGYVLDADGFTSHDRVRSSRVECYKAARILWPNNSIWNGRKVNGGYRIDI